MKERKMKTKQIIRAKAFAIPNGLYCPDECEYNGGMLLDSIAYWSKAIFNRWVYTSHDAAWRNERREKFGWDGLDAKRQKYVALWLHEPTGENDQSNWMDHGIDGYDELDGWKLLTNYIPVEIFNGYKDGDTVTFDIPIICEKHLDDDDEDEIRITWIKVSVMLDQKNGRYPSNGLFHEVLEEKGAWAPCSVPSYRDSKKKIQELQKTLYNESHHN